MKQKFEYRVVWKRSELNEKKRVYKTLKGAEKMVAFLENPIEQTAKTHFTFQDLDEPYCCSGRECGCGGGTLREHLEEQHKQFPPLLWVRIEKREVGDWR